MIEFFFPKLCRLIVRITDEKFKQHKVDTVNTKLLSPQIRKMAHEHSTFKITLYHRIDGNAHNFFIGL